jgi:hypothetical protein
MKEQIDMLGHTQGKAFTEAEAFLTYLILCQEYPEAGKVWLIERTGAVLGRGPRVVYDLVTHWQKTREIIVRDHDPANRGRGSPKFVFHPKGFHPAVIDRLKARIERLAALFACPGSPMTSLPNGSWRARPSTQPIEKAWAHNKNYVDPIANYQ